MDCIGIWLDTIVLFELVVVDVYIGVLEYVEGVVLIVLTLCTIIINYVNILMGNFRILNKCTLILIILNVLEKLISLFFLSFQC